jgi:6-phosphogluconolactonase
VSDTPVPADLQVYATPDLAAGAAARRIVAAAAQAISDHGAFIVALSGGETPRRVYRQLAQEPCASSIDWKRVQVLWGDERCVPPDDPASNFGMARATLLARVPLPAANVHRIRGEDDPAAAATAYERTLRDLLRTPDGPPRSPPGGRIDLVLLGLGADGHTASLFPGAMAIHDSPRWVEAARHPGDARWRITLTPRLLNAAAEVVFLVWGADKAGIVRDVLEGASRPHLLPAQLITPATGPARWVLDAAAAASLEA